LLCLLISLAMQRARNQIRAENAQKRGGTPEAERPEPEALIHAGVENAWPAGESAQRRGISRGGHRVVREADQPEALSEAGEEGAGLGWIADKEPSPDMAVRLADECEYILGKSTEWERNVLLLLMEGLTQPEIASRLNCCLATVERTM